MEEIFFSHSSLPSSSSTTHNSLHKNSQVISKYKPKIRIIHIFTPEIIKTDVANFPELVQRLTGKPEERKSYREKKTTKKLASLDLGIADDASNKSIQLQDEWPSLLNGEKMIREEENEACDNGCDSSGSFLHGFADLDGFIQELRDSSSHIMPVKSSHSPMGWV